MGNEMLAKVCVEKSKLGGSFCVEKSKMGGKIFFFWTLLAVFLNTYSDVFRKCRYKLDKCC